MWMLWGVVLACGDGPANDADEPHAPTMHREVFAVDAGSSLCASVKAADPDGDAVRFEMVDEPAHGTVQLSSVTGHFLYVPEPDYAGPDSFSVVANDGLEDSPATPITLTVIPKRPRAEASVATSSP